MIVVMIVEMILVMIATLIDDCDEDCDDDCGYDYECENVCDWEIVMVCFYAQLAIRHWMVNVKFHWYTKYVSSKNFKF